MMYRPEIDGLRAIAVAAIVLFHTDIELFDKAFIGVDVFFVISGYLITGLIITKHEDSTFTLFYFYQRRVRRLFPSLFLITLVCIPFAYSWMLTTQFKDFSQSLVAATLFLSNILFWLESQYYFAASSSLKPLLHTWSLGVEEQFYFCYPLLLMPLLRFCRRQLVLMIALMTVCSAAYTEFFLANNLNSQYYLPQARVWLFGVGALIYLMLKNNDFGQHWVSGGVALLGVSLFFLPIVLVSNNVFFERNTGVLSWTTLSILGVALMIGFANGRNIVGQILSFRLLVGLGLISYSFYLWHFPIFAFARIRLFEVSVGMYMVLTTLALILSVLSWRWVEIPFRSATRINNTVLFVIVMCASFLSLSIGAYGVLSGGQMLGMSSKTDGGMQDNYGLARNCTPRNSNGSCQTSTEPELIVWGDSFAMHIVEGIVQSNAMASLIQFTSSACSPIPVVLTTDPIDRQYQQRLDGCNKFNSDVLSSLDEFESAKYVIISSRFSNHFTHHHLRLVASAAAEKVEGERAILKEVTNNFHLILEAVTAKGLTPVIISEPSRPPSANIVCAASAIKFDREPGVCNFNRSHITAAQMSANKMLKEIDKDYKVIWLDEFICRHNECFTLLEKIPIYTNGGHLSREGSALIGQRMDLYLRITGHHQ
jgi:peptidoglycan/LPS O-acetylase OafA/YrhL